MYVTTVNLNCVHEAVVQRQVHLMRTKCKVRARQLEAPSLMLSELLVVRRESGNLLNVIKILDN